jgi:hypothetical protein
MDSSFHPPKASRSAPTPEENDALWRLLGECPPPAASGSFVASTMRAVRLEEDRHRTTKPSWFQWILVPALSCLLLTGAVFTWSFLSKSGVDAQASSLHTEEVDMLREELHLMTYVDELLTVSDPTTLDDAGLAELF